jgi:hypothetical protein
MRERDSRNINLALAGTLLLYVIFGPPHLATEPVMPDKHFENAPDQTYKQHFSEQAQQGSRDPFHGTPAERQQQQQIAEDKELERQRVVNADPVPSGEGENIHEHDAQVAKHEDSPPALPESSEAVESSDTK